MYSCCDCIHCCNKCTGLVIASTVGVLAAVPLASEDKQAQVQAAKTAADMWKAIGKDSWVVVPIASTSRPGQFSCDTHCPCSAETKSATWPCLLLMSKISATSFLTCCIWPNLEDVNLCASLHLHGLYTLVFIYNHGLSASCPCASYVLFTWQWICFARQIYISSSSSKACTARTGRKYTGNGPSHAGSMRSWSLALSASTRCILVKAIRQLMHPSNTLKVPYLVTCWSVGLGTSRQSACATS